MKPLPPADGEITKRAVGVKFSPDGSSVDVAIAVLCRSGCRGHERAHAELLFAEETFGGVQWLVDWLVERRGEIASVAVDGREGGRMLVDELRRCGMPKKALRLMGSADAVAAATTLVNMVSGRRLTHYPDQTLDASARSAVRRKIGADGYGLGGDSLAAEAAAAAVWAVMTTKRNPSRRQDIG